ncbi:MAG: GNAT family N-acetyltransferase [Bacillota bacterium]
MKMYEIDNSLKNKVTDFFKDQWGNTEMVISSGTYDCSTLNGYTMLNKKDEIIGLITYVISKGECEIISLDSIEEEKGIGTRLVKQVEAIALSRQCTSVKLVTTNDNLLAIKFYQKRKYRLSKIIIGGVDHARKLKPEIPLIGNDGIPIKDEIELIKRLN